MAQTVDEGRRRADVRASRLRASEDAVLFVDDEPMIGRLFVRSMRQCGYQVTAVTSAEEALAQARTRGFKVVVTDLRMPGMDGLTLIEQLRGVQPDLVFIIVTGMPEMDMRRSADTDASILATIAKPWEGNELRDVVRRAVELYDRRQQKRARAPGRLSALVIEDEPADAALVTRYLERRCDANVELASRVSEAEVMLAQHVPDLVVADLSLPDARGLDAVRRIRRAAPESAVVVMSGIDDDALARQALRLGAQDFLVKGEFDPRQLRRAVTFAMERELHVTSLVSLAHYDSLTGLANRRTLHDRYVLARSLARDSGTELGFLSIDLDRFKTINDTLGHEAGDALLQEVAGRIEKCVRDHDTVARLGGDEFAVLLTEIAGPDDAAVVARRILRALRDPFEIEGTEMLVTASVGALVPDDDATLDDVLRAADKTMYEAKRCGRNQLVQAGVAHAAQSHDRLVLEREITAAVREHRFALHYQPQYRCGDGVLAGFEALMRWTRLDGSRVSPGVFIPLLEELGLIAELGPWLLEEACAELQRYEAASGRSDVRMAVNLSGQQFERHGLVESVARALAGSGVAPHNLELEITEGLLMRDTDQTRAILEAFRDLGVRVAIDDFGTGYSSLAYLQRFEVSTLKIDRCFIQQMGDDRGCCIAEAVISLGHRLGMEIVAEGVETEAQLAHLRAEGCELVQGFLLARPGPSTLEHVETESMAS